tara:strand:+ start:494 stop:670 length:177 start_codon:yes stop_codon:yes gene_type:complete
VVVAEQINHRQHLDPVVMVVVEMVITQLVQILVQEQLIQVVELVEELLLTVVQVVQEL